MLPTVACSGGAGAQGTDRGHQDDRSYHGGLPTMFRRRTDQVYSTLQQVQRRITEQNGNPADGGEPLPPGQPPAPLNLQPLSQALPTGGIPVLSTTSPGQPFAGVGASRLGPGGNRYVLQLSGDLAMLLVVMWLISMAVMFVLGQQWRPSAGAGLAAGPAGSREVPQTAPPAKRLGDWIYILESRPNSPIEIVNSFEQRARELNEHVLKNPQPGWEPYFGVRKPDNGGIELVFGAVDRGVYGVDRTKFVEFAKMLSEPGGGGYASARWVKVAK